MGTRSLPLYLCNLDFFSLGNHLLFLPFLSSGVACREYSLPTKNEVPIFSGNPYPKTGMLQQCDSPMHG
jgi:hypothetical protein